MRDLKTWLLVSIVALAVIGAAYEGVALWYHVEPSDRLLSLHGAALIVLVILWVDADSREHPSIYRPFEYGYLALLFWLPYVPYYLWRTRRFVGVMMLGGFVGLFFLGYLTQWVVYAAR
jgi:hypothetical protein